MAPEDSQPRSQIPLLVPVLSKISSIHAIPTDLFKIRLNIIIPSTSGL
jgi:hypothetical protein